MKISIGSKYLDKPFGGGNEFVKNLTIKLLSDGHEVIDSLNDNDIDIILLINPLRTSTLSTFNHHKINYYKKFKNNQTISVHRINECDERKGTNYVNKKIIKANKEIDSNIFVSAWLKDLFLQQGIEDKISVVVKGGPLQENFNNKNKLPWDRNQKLKIVTHHWSDNKNKGIELYKKIDQLCGSEKFKNKISFTYIGNLSKDVNFKNTTVLAPMQHYELAKELKKHHVYVSGSLNEPSGNHHMEGAMCGLPILYVNSGALPEYCENFGICTNLENIDNDIEKMMIGYDNYFLKVKNYPFSFEYAYDQIIKHFEYLLDNKNLIESSNLSKSKAKALINLIIDQLIEKIYSLYIFLRKFFGKIKRFFNE